MLRTEKSLDDVARLYDAWNPARRKYLKSFTERTYRGHLRYLYCFRYNCRSTAHMWPAHGHMIVHGEFAWECECGEPIDPAAPRWYERDPATTLTLRRRRGFTFSP